MTIPESAIWQQNCFLKAHRWLQLGKVLYMYWLNTVSLTRRCSISWYACMAHIRNSAPMDTSPWESQWSSVQHSPQCLT